MDRAEYVKKRKGKYMAQALEAAEEMMIATLDPSKEGVGQAIVNYRSRRDAPQDADKRAFERYIEPLLPPQLQAAFSDFKGTLRARFNALATDATEIMSLGDAGSVNGFALELRDHVSPAGRP